MTGLRQFGPATLRALLLCLLCSWAVSAPAQTVGEFWPEANVYLQFPHEFRMLAFTGLKKGEDYPYQQINAGVGFGHQWMPITREHTKSPDPDKEYTLLLAGGYEYLHSLQSGNPSVENRLGVQFSVSMRPASRLLLQDRNRIEFRWKNGTYSTRYRNMVSAQTDFKIHKLRLLPYGAAEFFYAGERSSWNEEQYTAGVEIPIAHLLSVSPYYLRENCTTCTPGNLNVGGLKLNFYLSPRM